MKPGDIVKLRSGGPLMTVEELVVVEGVEQVRCLWFQEMDGVWDLRRAPFLSTSLAHAS